MQTTLPSSLAEKGRAQGRQDQGVGGEGYAF